MGLTNNEVKFLVTLDIDEDKSKKKIDSFLDKTIKEQKIVFDVAVGKSEHNINEFLKKHKEKKASILFDVAVGKSNKNISDYLANRKQDTQSLIFYVNEGATRSRINSALSTMSFNPALITLKVDTKLSLANINKFIDNVKVHKKNIELDVDNTTGFKSINEKIDKKQLSRAKVSLSLATGSFDSIGEAVKGRVFTGATFVGSLDVDATKQRIENQISKMKLPKITVDVEPIVAQIKQPKTTATQTSTPVKQPAQTTSTDDLLIGSQTQVFKQIKDEYKSLGQTVELFNKSRAEGEEAFVERLKKQGKQVEVIRNAQTKEITKITTTYKNSANETQKDVFVPFVKSYKETADASNEAVREVRGFVAETNKLKNIEKFNLSSEVEKFRAKLEEARHSATATARVLDEFGRKASNATSRNEIDKLNRDLEKHQAEQRKRNQLDKEKIQLTAQQEQLMANLTRIQKMYLRTVDKDEANRIKQSVEALKQLDILKANGKNLYKLDMGSVREAKEQISLVNNDIKRLNANATEASKASLGVVASLKTAMEKFPIWMLASTAFYGVIATFREFGSVIVDIDKKMTDLKKVMAEDTDFGAIFDQATHSAETFGKTISETLDAYNMFAKQGFKGDELQTLANAGLVAGNVGDIEAGKASEYLTASILQWDKDTNEAMSVVDSWNEISNNFATTVENLAQGQAKAGATARALGMDFDQLNAVVGTLNARTKQSGNEIGNFVKSTFSNILSAKAGSILDELGVDLENADGTMRDIMEVYRDVAKVYVTLDQADKNRVTLGLAGKYHISRMQTLLDDLGKADSMYEQMYQTSQNSANSAMSENQKYMQSLEARINLARVEIEKLSLAVGEAFMTEGMIQALQAFRVFAEAITTVVKEVGFLPVALLSVVTALALLSNRFGDVIGRLTNYIGSSIKAKKATTDNARATATLAGATRQSSTATAQDTVKTNANTTATNANTEAKKRASKASKLLSLGFGALGIGAIAVGFGIEKLVGWIGKARQEQEDYANRIAEETASYTQSRDTIKELSKEYERLSKLHSSGDLDPNTEEYKKYTEVQNELANLLPDLKLGEDGLGNSILKSSSYIKLKIEMLEKQLEAQKALNEEEAKAKREEDTKTAKDTIKDSKDDIDSSLHDGGNLSYKLKFVDQNYSKHLDFKKDGKKVSLKEYLGISDWGEDLKDVEHLMKTVNTVQKLLNNKEKYKLSEGQVNTLTWVLEDLQVAYDKASKASNTIASANETLRGSYADTMKEMIDSTENLADEAKVHFEDVAFSTLALADSEEEFEAISNAFGAMTESTYVNKDVLEDVFTSLANVTTDMKNSGITDVTELEAKYKETFEKIKEIMLRMSGFEVGSGEYKALSEALDRVTVDIYDFEVQVLESAKAQGKSKDEARELLQAKGELEEGVSSLSEELENEVAKLQELDEYYEKLTGVSEAQIEKADELAYVYDTLSDKTERTAEENELLEETFKVLNKLYPHLTENGKIRTDNIRIENEATKALHEAYQASKDGILSAEEQKTLGQAENVYARMQNLKKEAEAIQAIQNQYAETSKMTDKMFADLVSMGAVEPDKYSFWIPGMETKSASDIISNASKVHSNKINSLMSELQYSTDSLSNSVKNATAREKEREKAQKDAEKTQTLLQKVTDKYSLTLDNISAKLQKINSKKSKYAKGTEEYRNALREENALLQEQIGIYQNQAKELGGSVSNGTTTYSTASATTSRQLSGWNHNITSGYGAKESFRKSPHTGVDVDGYLGERLDANVAGTVIARGYTDLSGNYIKVRDNNGYEHFYGHLNKITAQLNQIVKVGDQLGEIGNTGNVVKGSGDGSHLHYEIKLNGKQVDPTNFAKNAKGVKTLNLSTASTGTSSKASGNSNQAVVWNYFKNKGLSDSAVAGIMGNIQQESNFNPNAVNKTSGATGIFQWLGSRLKELKAYASKQGKSHTDLQTQLDFAWKELQSTEKKSLTSLQKSMSVSQHASEFERLFERSGGSQVAKRQNYANNWYNQYAGSGGSNSTSSSSINGGGYDNEAQSYVYNLIEQEQKLLDQIEANRFEIMQDTLLGYRLKKESQEQEIARQEAIKAGYLTTSDLWEQATNAQYNAQKAVRQNVNDELWQLNQYLEKSNLTGSQRQELLKRQAELNIELKEAFNGIKEYYSQVVQGRLDRFDTKNNSYRTEVDWEAVKIQSVDPTSERYVKTLERANKFRQLLVDNIAEEQKYIEKQLASGEITIDMYQTLTEKARELKNESIEAVLALQQANYEIVQTGVNKSNRKIDDIDFAIDRSKGYQALYEEGSANHKLELEFQLERLQEKLTELESQGKQIQLDMRGKNLGHAELEQLEEQLEDNVLAVLDLKDVIQETQEELKKFDDIINEQIKEKREDVIDDILDTLRDSYEELRDIENDRYDNLIEKENERHEEAMKNLDDELEAFNKIIDAKRREINDEDRDRSHNNKVDELTEQKQELQQKLNLLSNVNTYDGKKEREELQKKIDEIDKQLLEEDYQYKKELRLQQLDDELEEKTEHIDNLKEIEDENTKNVLKNLEKEKEYWDKYYQDILNDEREFERLREEMLKGHYEEIEAKFAEHAGKLKASLPDLEVSISSMTERVGTQIRENVIYELSNLVKEIKKVEEEVKKLEDLKTTSNLYGGSTLDRNPANSLNDENGKLKEADLKVIMAKFMNEQIAGKLDASEDKVRIQNIKDRATTLAEEGRAEGSKLSANNHSLNDIMSSLNQDQLKQVGEYFQNNSSESEFQTQLYKDYIEDYGKNLTQGQTLSTGDKTVLLGKFINRNLVAQTSNKSLQGELETLGSSLGKEGRKSVTVVSPTVSFDNQLEKLTQKQRAELGDFMLKNSHLVTDGFLRTYLEEYAGGLKLAYTDQYNSMATGASLDTGGMTKAFGSSGGVDGKGGKMAILHEREIVLNPVDTARILNVASIMENIMKNIGGAIKLPTLPKLAQANSTTSTNETTNININVAKLNGTQSDIDNLAKQIQNRLLREKGKR